jgi:hypothetical protein
MADHAFGLPSLAEVAVQTDKEILAGYSPPPRIEGVTILSGSGVLASGTILGRVTASGKYIQFLDTAVDGSEVPVGVLRNMVDATSADRPGEMIVSGLLKSDQIVEPTNGTVAEAIVVGGAFTGAFNDATRNVLRLG